MYGNSLFGARQAEARVHEAMEWFSLRRTGQKNDESIMYQPSDLRLLTYFSEVVAKAGYEVPGLSLGKRVKHAELAQIDPSIGTRLIRDVMWSCRQNHHMDNP